MDESQIESKISDILEKLIETFDKKYVLIPEHFVSWTFHNP